MLMKKHLTLESKAELEGLATRNGWTLRHAIQSGIDNPDSSIGIYAGDSDSYAMFSRVFDPVIREHSRYDMRGHPSDFSLEGLPTENLDPEGKFIVSTRIRVGRNLATYAFPPAISAGDRARLEAEIVGVLLGLTGELTGTYHPLGGMTEEERQEMVDGHFLFKQGDRFLESAGVNRDWPEGRGIYHSSDKRFLVWVGEEDSMRIISMQEGADIAEAFTRLKTALDAIGGKLDFASDEIRGFHTACPTNLGTAMRASVHIKLPLLSGQPGFERICDELGLSIRGLHGEHSEALDGIHDISNKYRLGITEREIYWGLYDGVRRLIALESALARALSWQ
ncbi:phosphagen kinase [Vitiosangium sp. GDMCC 1.1324]|uniref:phosphagen kinase n=1 Tax=Vitiosangium sp. (strain GDMCC 1.1324) TaxID=2138576 RepID=UPI000D341C39|nr:phosphagen kinase [Vitiosangium sp. GDMCC 1.1324]PTL75256.1 arginine kinase [Vitiosangium sp. GDMCC 1.1324]